MADNNDSNKESNNEITSKNALSKDMQLEDIEFQSSSITQRTEQTPGAKGL